MNDSGHATMARTPSENASSTRAATNANMSITCYESQIPAFVETELERLYASLFSSLPAIKLYAHAEGLNTYVVRKGGEIVTVWLFQHSGRQVRVINEGITIGSGDILRFSDYIFASYPSVGAISFHAVESAAAPLPYPLHRFNCTDDAVLGFPATSDEHLEHLGKATKRDIKRYMNRFNTGFPSFRCRAFARDEVGGRHIRDVINLNRTRMLSKGKVSAIDDDGERRIIQLAKSNGFADDGTIDGRVCASAITFRYRDNYFSFVRAHELAYDDYRLGLLGAHLLISECIARSGKEPHFMWGREEHKTLPQEKQKNLDHLTVYRSWAHLLLNADAALKNALTSSLRRAKLQLLVKAKRGDDAVARLAGKLLDEFRRPNKWKHRRQTCGQTGE